MRKIMKCVVFFVLTLSLQAKVRLPALVGDNMVLQQNSLVNIWGWASPSQKITVRPSWSGAEYVTHSDTGGRWEVKVQTPVAGKAVYQMSIDDGEPLLLEGILVGEVWICAGQSNMEMPVHGFYGQPVEGSQEAIYAAHDYPDIRLFSVTPDPQSVPQDDCKGTWEKASPLHVRDFSAVAYFFGKHLNRVLDVPVGLIAAHCGGTGIEAWMSEDAIRQTEGIDQEMAFKPINDWKSTVPSHLYNGMITPIARYTARGFTWYQGESNLHNYRDYPKLKASLVQLWRQQWGDPDMPFYYVQLVPFTYDGRARISLPLMIESQYKALDIISNAGIVATTDLGHPAAIHPPRKREIGMRLAALALQKTYAVSGLMPEAPRLDSAGFEQDKVVLRFKHIADYSPAAVGSFDAYNGPVQGFEIAGADRKFYPAEAKIIENKNCIEVSAAKVPQAVAVRYAFRNIHEGNVRTTEGLPLVPFRTDNWDDAY